MRAVPNNGAPPESRRCPMVAIAGGDLALRRHGSAANPLSAGGEYQVLCKKKEPRLFAGLHFQVPAGQSAGYAGTTLMAFKPFGPFSTSKVTVCPSVNVLKPLP